MEDSVVLDVQQSEAVRRLWAQVNSQIEQFVGKDFVARDEFEALFDEVRNFVELSEEDVIEFNRGLWAPDAVDFKWDSSREPYEKMLTRFSLYQKALCYMAQHFRLLTPILADIKQAYEDVFEKGEKETKEAEKDQMELLELRQALGKHVCLTDRKGHRLLMQVRAEAHVLQEHIQCQQHTMHTLLGMLWKLRSSLKLTSWAVAQLKHMHRSKIDALAKEIVTTQGSAMFDMALPGKYAEIMKRIKDNSNAKDIRKMLLAARRQLRAANKKITTYETDYANTVPKFEYEILQRKLDLINKKNKEAKETNKVVQAERLALKQQRMAERALLREQEAEAEEDEEEEEEETESAAPPAAV